MDKDNLFEQHEHINRLYDLYKNLLTDKQRNYFETYYFNDLSLSEIASLNEVSRNAVFLSLKGINKSLEEYEEKLQLLKKNQMFDDICDRFSTSNNDDVKQIIASLKELEL